MTFSKTLKIVAKGHWEDTVIGDIHSIGQIVSLAETGKETIGKNLSGVRTNLKP